MASAGGAYPESVAAPPHSSASAAAPTDAQIVAMELEWLETKAAASESNAAAAASAAAAAAACAAEAASRAALDRALVERARRAAGFTAPQSRSTASAIATYQQRAAAAAAAAAGRGAGAGAGAAAFSSSALLLSAFPRASPSFVSEGGDQARGRHAW